MNIQHVTLRRTVLAGMASVFATTVQAQGQADHAKSGGLDIYYEVHGDLEADATPFLVLHGGMGSIQGDFGHLLPILADRGPVIGIEQQGHGRTGGRDAPVSFSSMRADTIATARWGAVGGCRFSYLGDTANGCLKPRWPRCSLSLLNAKAPALKLRLSARPRPGLRRVFGIGEGSRRETLTLLGGRDILSVTVTKEESQWH